MLIEYKKRMIEFWKKITRFQKSQRLNGQTWMMIKKGWFSDLEILEIHQQINTITCQQDPNSRIELEYTEKKEHSTQIEPHSNSY